MTFFNQKYLGRICNNIRFLCCYTHSLRKFYNSLMSVGNKCMVSILAVMALPFF